MKWRRDSSKPYCKILQNKAVRFFLAMAQKMQLHIFIAFMDWKGTSALSSYFEKR